MDTLMMMKLGDNESIKDYSTRFWETYNNIDGCGEDMAVRTFKLGLPPSIGLCQSLTKRPPSNIRKLMDRIKQFIRVEEDRGNSSTVQPETPVQPPSSKPQVRIGQTSKTVPGSTNFVTPSFKVFQMVFKEPIYRILNKIMDEPFFVWPPKLPSDPAAQNKKLQCFYHWDKGHLTENCHKFKTYLEQLVSDGHLSEYVDSNLTEQKRPGMTDNQSGNLGTAPTGVIHVILNPLCTSILPVSFRSDLQKAAHLKQSFGVSDSIHFVPKFCSEIPN